MNAGHAFRLSAPGARASLEGTIEEHRAIYEALVARDGELAASRTAAHIDSAWAERRTTSSASLPGFAAFARDPHGLAHRA